MMRSQGRSRQFRLLTDSAFLHGRLLRTGIVSLLLHVALMTFLALGMKPFYIKGRPVIYQVTLQTVPPQENSSPDAAPFPIPPKTQIKKEARKWKQEIIQKEDIFEKKNLDSDIHPSTQTVAPKIPMEEEIQPSLPQKKEEVPILLPLGVLSTSDKNLNIKAEDNLPTHLSLSRLGEENQNIISGARSGERLGQGSPSSVGSGDGSGLGRGGFSGGGPGNGSGTGQGGSGGAGSQNYGIGASHPRHAENPKPIYPVEAREKGYKGEVLLKVEVLSNGRVGQIEVKKSSGHEILDQTALSTVKKWKLIPAQKGGVSIPFWVNIPVKFELQ